METVIENDNDSCHNTCNDNHDDNNNGNSYKNVTGTGNDNGIIMHDGNGREYENGDGMVVNMRMVMTMTMVETVTMALSQ